MHRIIKSITVVATAVLLVAVMLLSGCTARKTAGGTAGTANSSGIESDMIGNVYKKNLPIVKDKITVNICTGTTPYNKISLNDMENTKEFEKRTNIHVDFMEIPNQMKDEKVNIMLASANLPDAFMRAVTSNQLINNYSSGLFKPLDDLISSLAPNIKGFISDPDVKAQVTLPDGRIYSTPSDVMAPWTQVEAYTYINRDWLNGLGLKLPATTEEFKNALIAFKNNDADGNGKIGNEIPFSFTGTDNLRYMLGNFGIPCDGRYINIQNGKLTYVPTTSNFKQAIEYFNSLYKAGVLDQESFSQNVSQLRAKGKDMVLGAYVQFLASSTVGADKAGSYQHLMPLKGPNGDQKFQQRYNAIDHGLVISAKTKYPEALIRWVDYLNTDTIINEALAGLESQGVWSSKGGTRYVMNSDKTPAGLGWTEWLSNIGWNSSSPFFQSEDFVAKNRVLDNDQITKDALDRRNEIMKYGVSELFPLVMIDPKINEEITSIQNELSTILRNGMARAIINGVSDADWKEFQDNLKRAKYERYVELLQKVYDDYKKK